jgi:hypothetical protein
VKDLLGFTVALLAAGDWDEGNGAAILAGPLEQARPEADSLREGTTKGKEAKEAKEAKAKEAKAKKAKAKKAKAKKAKAKKAKAKKAKANTGVLHCVQDDDGGGWMVYGWGKKWMPFGNDNQRGKGKGRGFLRCTPSAAHWLANILVA